MQHQQFQQYQPTQMRTNQFAPNASISTMGPDTYQNSPFTQHGYNMGQQYQQHNQQQEQEWVQQVRQELQSGQNLRPQMGQIQNTMGQQGQNASLPTMDPTTYQNSPYVGQQFRQQSPQQLTLQQPMTQQFYSNPNASIATMGPDTFQNSPYNQHGFQMSQHYQQQNPQQQEQEWLQQVRQELQSGQTLRPQMGQIQNTMGQQGENSSLATMDPTTYQNSPYISQQFRQQDQPNFQQQPIRIQGQLRQNTFQQGSNSSLATMDPTTYQNSPYNRNNF